MAGTQELRAQEVDQGNRRVGVSYRTPSEEEEADEAVFKQLEEAFCS